MRASGVPETLALGQ
ncbi:unnamed protein product, partial [Didymodactylos carnosus]